uniref:Uncharacterized protein n=1 Tax=Caenorhabditis tropicalis TaxID=1561998 RepID=A0A1I7USI6_9PELO
MCVHSTATYASNFKHQLIVSHSTSLPPPVLPSPLLRLRPSGHVHFHAVSHDLPRIRFCLSRHASWTTNTPSPSARLFTIRFSLRLLFTAFSSHFGKYVPVMRLTKRARLSVFFLALLEK